MRVLVLNRVGHLGGVERILLTLASGLQNYGYKTILACPGTGALPDAARAQGTEVVPCSFDRMRITADPRVLTSYPRVWMRGTHAVERACREYEIQLVHAHHPVSALYALRACRRFELPLVLHVHETLPAKPLYAIAMRLVLPRASLVLCVSSAAEALAVRLGANPARTRVIHNGVDRHFLEAGPLPPPPDLVQAAGAGPHVGLFGVIEERKAQHLLLDAAEALASDFPAARYWLVGPAALKDKQNYADELYRRCNAPALRGRAFLVGFQAAVKSWIGAMDVVVQPSTSYESFGMSLAEAAALGRPVIASRVGGMPEIVQEGVTGLIVSPGDAVALADALATLFSNPRLRAQLGAGGEADTKARFAPEIFQAAVANAYSATLIQFSRPG